MSISFIGTPEARGREFPTLGSENHPVTATTRARFFVTGPFARTDAWSSARHMKCVHAKAVGSTVTVCGLATHSWTTLWEFPFKACRLQGACQTCLKLVERA
jgi:hypothetical protein